ncbi:MAG: TadE/TadG family type IV pilus assembly protein [Maricaulaceae bacterium]
MKYKFPNPSKVLEFSPKIMRHFAKNTQGVAAIEFAFIAPIMIAIYFGLAEISMAIGASRNVSHSTNVAGDLLTQAPVTNRADMEDILEASLAVMQINPARRQFATIELSSYRELTDGTRERIGYARLGSAITSGPETYNSADIDDALISSTSGAIISRVNYNYEPTTFKFMNNVTLNEEFILKPRVSSVLPFDEGGNNTFMCTADAALNVSCTASTTTG